MAKFATLYRETNAALEMEDTNAEENSDSKKYNFASLVEHKTSSPVLLPGNHKHILNSIRQPSASSLFTHSSGGQSISSNRSSGELSYRFAIHHSFDSTLL